MSLDRPQIWKNTQSQQLATTLCAVTEPGTMRAFLGDLLSKKEIVEIGARLQAARMLQDGQKYTDIITTTRLSSRTVARISDWLQNGCGGYRIVLSQISAHQHIPPARAD